MLVSQEKKYNLFLLIFTMCMVRCLSASEILIRDSSCVDTFPIVSNSASDILCDTNDPTVVGILAKLFSEDIQRVTGKRPEVLSSLPKNDNSVIIIGVVGSKFINDLEQSGKLDVSDIKGKWESYKIATVKKPFKGIAQALVIAGSDRRAVAYGVFSISESMGVSPWYYWADVPTKRKEQIHISTDTVLSKEPGVKYRGIFINDEDWGLQPWAAKHLDTDIKDIGPKTYAKVFELMLRLKANYLWPGMHPCTQAFNIYPENKVVADNYAIVMGASHCEPMLRNNVTEWDKKTMGEWNYDTNKDIIYDYWDSRVAENGKYENIYTVGMRGIHDSDMPGGGSINDKRDRLERVINDQRKMLAEHVNSDPSKVPQIFCPYKEVLNIYKAGLELPEDVTMVWPDDNFGYIRTLSTPEERKRSGGSGVYYHMSYWGSPQDFLWISSTSPALISYEMNKARAYDADRVWMFNVGDIKPIEMEMEFALRLAYDPDSWPAERAMGFIEDWASRTFGKEFAANIAEIQKEYYRLTQQVKPEHIDRVTFSNVEMEQRLADYDAIVASAEKIYKNLTPEYYDAFYQLVLYPVKSASLMNQKHTYSVLGNPEKAMRAYDGIQKLAKYYNKQMAGGKWDGMMDPAPRNTRVFHEPDVKSIKEQGRKPNYLRVFKANDAKVSGGMRIVDDTILSADPEIQRDGSDSKAIFTHYTDNPQAADIYFLAKCVTDKQDSWFVSCNERKVVSNDQPTGNQFKWLKVMGVELVKGANVLTVTQREPGAVIKQIAIVTSGKGPENLIPEPLHIFAANDYSSKCDTAISKWKAIEGLGLERYAMTVFPYETLPINESDFATAPSINYSFEDDGSDCVIEARFLPTHHINDKMKLRYAVEVDGGSVQIRDIYAGEWSRDWSSNVLRGYSAGSTTHKLSDSAKHKITIYLLDPGMVLSQVRIFSD